MVPLRGFGKSLDPMIFSMFDGIFGLVVPNFFTSMFGQGLLENREY